jgi:hypothetical protein
MSTISRREYIMKAERIRLDSVEKAREAIDAVGANNSEFMATRAVHINILLRQVPGVEALFLKRTYNDIGAEAAISSHAYQEEEGAVTDVLVMGTIYHHREVRRILTNSSRVQPWIAAIAHLVEQSPEILG